jgi:peroxiredoxin-like protein
MKPLPHRYAVEVSGAPDGYAAVRSPGVPDLLSAPPADFDGPGDAWSPEQLLLGAVAACFTFTLRAVARASGLAWTRLDLGVEGTVDRRDGVTRFTEIRVRPRLAIAAGTDAERARRILEKAERACLVSASLATPIRLEPEVVAAA